MTELRSDWSQGTLLNGTVHYAQPLEGYRTGLEPVLLAASVPARAGQRVLEAGTGSGAGLLCLLARVPGIVGAGLDLDPAAAALARFNLAANGYDSPVHVGDVADAPRFGPFDHAFANPPWHDPAGTPPDHPARNRAKHLPPEGLAPWVTGLAAALVAKGTLSLVLPATLLGRSLVELDRVGFRASRVLPLWPRAGVAAKLVIVQARRGAAGTRLLPGLLLHDDAGLTEAAQAVLREKHALPL